MAIIDYHNLPDSIDQDRVATIVAEFSEKLDIDINDQILEIVFYNKDQMKDLNHNKRGVNSSTDVLSFPQAETPSPQHIFGTIVISLEDAKERDEDAYDLIKHGLLHLAGYDHEVNHGTWRDAAQKINHTMG